MAGSFHRLFRAFCNPQRHGLALALVAVALAVVPAWDPAIADPALPESALPEPALPEPAPPDSAARPAGVADTVTTLPPFRVDAPRTTDPAREAATIVQFDSLRIRRFNPRTVGDVLLAAPGVDVIRSGPWASRLSLRGLSGERVLVLVDGLRLSSGRGHGAQTSLVATDNLEAMEVMPGASGAAYGSDALAGVIQLQTLAPLLAEEPAVELALAGRLLAPGQGRGAWGRARILEKQFGVELAGAVAGLEHLAAPGGTLPNSGSDEIDWRLHGMGQFGTSLFDLSYTRHAAYHVGLPVFQSDAGSHAEYPRQERETQRLEWTRPGGGRHVPDARVLAYHQRFGTRFVETTVDSQFLRGQYVASRMTRAEDAITTNAVGAEPSLMLGRLRLGGTYRHEETGGPRGTDVTVANSAGTVTSATTATGESVPNARRDVWSVSAGGAYEIDLAQYGIDRLRLEAGARFDHMHSWADSTANSFTSELNTVDQRPSGEIGAVVGIKRWSPYARLATGFRAPNLEERYFNSDVHGGLRIFGNPDLRAEHSTTLEIGTRFATTARGTNVEGRVSLYRSDVSDLITLVYLGQLYMVPRFQYSNVEHARLDGFETELHATRGRYLVSVAAAFPRGKNLDTNEPIVDLGAARATIDGTYSLHSLGPDGAVSLRARWTDASLAEPEDIGQPSFWTFAAQVGGTLFETHMKVAVTNLMNVSYHEPMSALPEAGRTVSFAIDRAWSWSPKEVFE